VDQPMRSKDPFEHRRPAVIVAPADSVIGKRTPVRKGR